MSDTSITTAQHMNDGTVKGKQQGHNTGKKAKQPMRSARVNEVHKQCTYATIMVVAASAVNIESSRFPLYKPFSLSPESADLYIKVDKNTIVNLDTQERFAAEGNGYYVRIQLTHGGK